MGHKGNQFVSLKRVQAVVPGPGDEMWVAGSDPDVLRVYDPKKGVITAVHPLEPLKEGSRNLRTLTLGPDGNLWFAEPGGLGSMSGKGEYRSVALPQGGTPAELLAAEDGRIYFTLVGESFIGALTVVGPEAVSGPPAEERKAAGTPTGCWW